MPESSTLNGSGISEDIGKVISRSSNLAMILGLSAEQKGKSVTLHKEFHIHDGIKMLTDTHSRYFKLIQANCSINNGNKEIEMLCVCG